MKGNRLLTTDWVFMLVTHTGQDSSYSRTLPLVSHLNIRAWVTERLVNFLMLIGLLPLVLLVCIVQLAHPGWINLPFPEYLFESYYVSVWFAWILLLMHQTFVICMLRHHCISDAVQSRVLSHNIGAALNGEPVFRWLRSYLETGFPIGLSRATRLETCATRTTVGTASSDLRTLMTALHALSQRHAHNSRIPFDLNVPDRAACLPGVDVAMIKSCCFADDTFDIEFVLYGDVIYDAANRFREISLGRSAVSGTKCPLELFWLSTVLCSSCRPYLLHDINEESSEGMYQLTGDSSADEYRSVLDFRAATRPPSRRTVLPEKVAAADVAGRSAFSQTARRFQVDEHTGAVLNMHRRHFIDRRLLKSIRHDWVSHVSLLSFASQPPDRCIMDFAKRAGVCLIKRSSTQAAVHAMQTHDQLLWFDVLAWLPGDRALSEVEVVVVREVAHSKVYCLCRGPLTKIEKLLSSTSAQLERFNCMAARQGLTASYYLSRELKPEEIQSLQQNGSTNLDRALLTKGNMDLLGGFAIRENVDSVSQEVVDLMRDNGTRVWMTSNDTLVPSLAIAKHAEVVTCGHAVFVPEKQFGFWSTDIDACVGGNKKWPRRTSLTSRASSFRSRHSSRKSRLSETSGISMTIRKKTVTFSRAITRVSSTGLNRSLFRAATRVCRSSSHQSFVPVQTLQDVMESYKPTAVNRNIQADELLRRTHAISMMFDSMIAGKRSVAVVMPGDLVRLFLDNGMILNDFLLIVVNADAVIFYNMTPLLSRRLLRAVAKHVKPRLNVLVLGDSCGDSLMMMESVVSIAYVRQPPCSLLNRDVFPNVARFNAHFVVDDWKQIRWLIEVYGHHFNGASYNLLYWMSLTGVTTLVVLLWNVGRRQVTTWQVLIFYLVVGFPVALMSVVMPKTVVSRRFAVKDYVAPQALGLLFGMVLIVVNRCIEATSIDPHGRVFDSGQTDWVFTLCFLLVGALASSGLSRRGCFWWPLTPIPVALLSLWVLTFISFIVWAFFRLREDSSWITNFRWIITCPPLVMMSAFYRAVHWAELYSRSMPLSGRLWRGSIRACWEGFAYLRDQINIRVSRATVPRSPNCDDSSDFQPASVRNELPLDKYVTVSHMMTWKLTFRECQAEHCFRVMSSNFIKDTQWSRYCRAALLSMILYVTAKVILESSNPKPQPSLSVWCGTPLVIFLMVALGFTYSDLFFKEHAKFASLLNLSFSLLLIICYAAADIASVRASCFQHSLLWT
ncbi:MAG: LOW QUALITY PROTEIN: hypothetical protein KVP17_000348 [Porospora cf. gigantea B]|uniref:uncharacterized protein n=1 Tax=Porospora cf. gigantea B TaxID=2853592 RepID=UPI003571B133|nr:MAG: LOW QUALITY PROTEIN: hypothetical protein KVP17_000348 [Porospora cf. gigantea B]